MKALAEQIVDLDGVEVIGRAHPYVSGSPTRRRAWAGGGEVRNG
jgi:hypothetical protein